MGNTLEETTLVASRQFLRHTVATLAYRGGKALRGAPEDFSDFRISTSTRSSGEILAHIRDLLDWALSLARGQRALAAFDAYLESDAPLHFPAEEIFQGPIADALTHVGHIATRRSLAGAPVRGENYFVADIVVGRVGPEQSAPRREFD